MKFLLVTALSTLSGSASAWVLPTHKDVQNWVAAASIAGAITFSGPIPPSHAVQVTGAVFSHKYSDPKHPNCKRIVVVKENGDALVSGTDGNPGCPEDGSGSVWRLMGEVQSDSRILVDFSPKGGPSNLIGVWDPKDPAGIRWPDGNKWTVKD